MIANPRITENVHRAINKPQTVISLRRYKCACGATITAVQRLRFAGCESCAKGGK